jgi:hypothetical protein
MRRPLVALALSIGIGLVLVACSSPSGSPAESAGSEPSVPAAQSGGPAASQGGGGGEGEAPALADGPWNGGQGHTTTSGAVSWTTDASISTDVSLTEEAKTLLAYNTDDTFVTFFINFTGVPFHASVTAPDWDASSDNCEVTYARADDTGIDATFSCVADEFTYFGVDEEPNGEIMIEGSFTATR